MFIHSCLIKAAFPKRPKWPLWVHNSSTTVISGSHIENNHSVEVKAIPKHVLIACS